MNSGHLYEINQSIVQRLTGSFYILFSMVRELLCHQGWDDQLALSPTELGEPLSVAFSLTFSLLATILSSPQCGWLVWGPRWPENHLQSSLSLFSS